MKTKNLTPAERLRLWKYIIMEPIDQRNARLKAEAEGTPDVWYALEAGRAFHRAGYKREQAQAEKNAMKKAGMSWAQIWQAAQAKAAIR